MFGCHLGSTVCAKDTINLLLNKLIKIIIVGIKLVAILLRMMKSQNIALCVHPTVI